MKKRAKAGVKNQDVMICVVPLMCVHFCSIWMFLIGSCPITLAVVFRVTITVAPLFLMCNGV